MRDLPNERAEVVAKLQELNFEPVFAEGLLPDGTDSWNRLRVEIESCDIFVLILGEVYGYIPRSGPMADQGKSVTELELEVAKETGLPVLTFVKQLRLSTQPLDDDGRRREDFRERVTSWDGGLFRGEFELARDLATKTAHAVIGLISDRFYAAKLEQRRAARPPEAAAATSPGLRPAVPKALKEAVASRHLTLLLGAGASLSTGMPSAAAFSEAMLEQLQEYVDGYEPPRSGTTFNVLATDIEALLGRSSLYNLAAELVDPPFVKESAPAHRFAARLFDDVITTNFDRLLERAEGGSAFEVIDEEIGAGLPRQPRLFKIHGSISNPHSLVLTEADLVNLETERSRLWGALRELLARQPILVVGSSLRDPSLIRLFESVRDQIRGWVVMSDFNPSEQIRLRQWNLDLIKADADDFLAALAKS
jgi:hypothetical protein